MLRIFFACLLIFLAPYAQAKFTMPKYNFALKILATDELRSDLNAYPKISNILLNYDHYRTLLNEVHAIYTADHKQKWEIASDITIGMLENKPLYVDFSDKKAENRFSNNVVNYLTNNFELRQLGIIKEFFGSTLGKKYITTVIALYNERYHTVEEIYKKNYPVFAEPEQEKKSGKEFE
ncbi:MAG: hypothetical protein EB059_01220 [Alphaproteobacteria bacterium]|nr:hypothetical protein [Alphaproteobacteria bacterium]